MIISKSEPIYNDNDYDCDGINMICNQDNDIHINIYMIVINMMMYMTFIIWIILYKSP
jgi:hypothetical protein